MPAPRKVIAPRGVGAGSASAMPSHPNQDGRLCCLTMLGQVDGATGALADELDDAVAREDRADGQLPAHGVSLADVQVSRG
jgi:hypothetical protein